MHHSQFPLRQLALVVMLLGAPAPCGAFMLAPQVVAVRMRSNRLSLSVGATKEVSKVEEDEPSMNPNNPKLPELKGDFDWDAKFGGDADWITENIPGRVVLDEITLAKQVTALNQLEEKWRKERVEKDYVQGKVAGWTENAQLLNGRFAMFFLVTGLLTEYWTGVSLPGQVEVMLRTGGFLGME
jgi:hypothetical protein